MDMVLAVIGGLAAAVILWFPFFGDMSEFLECLRYWLTPDAFSFFRGEGMEDWWAEFKLGLWIFLSGAVGFGVYSLFH